MASLTFVDHRGAWAPSITLLPWGFSAGVILWGAIFMSVGNLFYWAIVFLIIAIVAGIFGFGGAEATAFSAAHLIFYIAIILLVVSLIVGFLRRGV